MEVLEMGVVSLVLLGVFNSGLASYTMVTLKIGMSQCRVTASNVMTMSSHCRLYSPIHKAINVALMMYFPCPDGRHHKYIQHRVLIHAIPSHRLRVLKLYLLIYSEVFDILYSFLYSFIKVNHWRKSIP